MRPDETGIDANDPYMLAHMAKRHQSSVMLQALKADPPHLVDVKILNKQHVPIWYTLEIHPTPDEAIFVSGWDGKRRRYVSFRSEEVIDMQLNSISYVPVDENEWEMRIKDTNLRFDEDKEIRQSKGKFW